MRRYVEDELDMLRSLLIRMSSIVDEQVDTAIQALEQTNFELSKFVIQREAKVNELDLVIEGQCQQVFALTQPVAIDLRLVLAAMHMNADLERIGDIAVNIAERVEALAGQENLMEDVGAQEMIHTARQMLTEVINAFIHSDSSHARLVFEKELIVDRLGHDAFYRLIDRMKSNPEVIEASSHLMALLRHIERLADHCTNIAETVIFVSEAKFLKHHGSELPEGDTL